MKFFTKSPIVIALLATAAAAQNAVIGAPPAQSTFSPGQSFTVEVERPDSLTNSQEVSVAIGLITCVGRAPSGTCEGFSTAEQFGSVLFAGPYTPHLPPGSTTLIQNFTVTVPNDFQTGPAALSVAHFNLVGALLFPSLEVLNETVFIQ